MNRRLAAILAADVVGYSRLMARHEQATLRALKAVRRELFDPEVARRGGRIVKLAGDGTLVEFGSALGAVEAAIAIQAGIRLRNATSPTDQRISLRIGVHLGDVTVEDGDLYGDGVNVAARLEGLASPGRVCLSQPVYDAVAASLRLPVRALGEQTLKNLSRPIRVFEVWPELGSRPEAQETAARQQIRFCTSEDEVRLAYARVGSGTTVVKAANYLNHLDYDWKSPIWRHVFQALAEKHLLIRYDERGNGMSDWNPAEISFEAFVRDLETVVDAAGLDRFALFGASQGCAVSIAYAVRHPERVTRLVLHGGYAVGPRRRGSPDEIAQRDALLTLIRQGWGQDNPAFRQMFTSLFIPDGSAEEIDWFNDLQRVSASPESATRIRRACDDIDVRELLGQVTAPTLVLHSRGDAVVPFEEGRRIASLVPGARFVALDSRNHLLLEHEPAWAQWLDEITDFLDEA